MYWILINKSKPNNVSKVLLTYRKTINSNQPPVLLVAKALYSKSLDTFFDLKEIESDEVIEVATTYDAVAWQPFIGQSSLAVSQLKPYNPET